MSFIIHLLIIVLIGLYLGVYFASMAGDIILQQMQSVGVSVNRRWANDFIFLYGVILGLKGAGFSFISAVLLYKKKAIHITLCLASSIYVHVNLTYPSTFTGLIGSIDPLTHTIHCAIIASLLMGIISLLLQNKFKSFTKE